MWKPLEVKKTTPISWCVMYTNPGDSDLIFDIDDHIRRVITVARAKGNVIELMVYVLKVNGPEVTARFRTALCVADEKLVEKFDKLALLV